MQFIRYSFVINPPMQYAFRIRRGDFRTMSRAGCELSPKSSYHVIASLSEFGPPLPCDSIAP